MSIEMDVYDFGMRLKQLRISRKLSITEVAKRVNVHRATIGSYERNVLTPSVDVLVKLALLYNTSIDYLLNLDKRMNIQLDGLTESQQEIVKNVTDMLIQELKKVPK